MLSKAEFQQCYIAYYPERGWAGHVIEGMRQKQVINNQVQDKRKVHCRFEYTKWSLLRKQVCWTRRHMLQGREFQVIHSTRQKRDYKYTRGSAEPCCSEMDYTEAQRCHTMLARVVRQPCQHALRKDRLNQALKSNGGNRRLNSGGRHTMSPG